MAKKVKKLNKIACEELGMERTRLFRVILLSVCGGLCGLFVIAGLILMLPNLSFETGVGYLVAGIVFAVITVLVYFFVKDEPNYEKANQKAAEFGFIDVYELNAKLVSLEEENNKLKKRIKELEK